ncbi:metal ABC transporter ATP-binding protein [Caldibacillus thermoamylovorans]|uniref:metal ABC transporter ATP-binding protein n=1 Tax=Caldibacillus thermoamylovorans TaxID=35841 RepID=UPI0022E806FA|nr:metal ABC transporter ATP-binding protein [Caldibacillus thermoamylovorans]
MKVTEAPIIEIKNLTYHYDHLTVLENINLQVERGDFLAIVGPNGSGKSTLLKLVLGLLKKQQGEIYLYGKPLASFDHWEKISFVSQKSNSFNSGFPATVYEVVRSGLTKKTGLFHFFPKNTREHVTEALKAVEMESFIDRNIGELSGGQQQRVFIARAIVSNPELLILDEPTVGVDAKRVAQFYQLLQRLNHTRNMTLIIVSHDVGIISDKVSHVACLNKTLYFHGRSQEFAALDNGALSFFYGHDVDVLKHDHT